jgi:signal transduction histidine kinase
MKRLIILFLIIALIDFLFAQKQGAQFIDSLKSKIQYTVEDTNKVKLLARLSFEYYGLNTDLGIKYGEQALELSEKLHWNKGIGMAYNSLGANWAIKSNYPKAFDCYLKSLTRFNEVGDKKKIANAFNNIGWLYIFEKQYTKSFVYLNKSLNIYTELNDKNGLASTYANLGICYSNQGNFTKANEYYYKVLQIHQQINKHLSVSVDFSNIAKNKMRMKEYCEALDAGFEGLKISEEINNTYTRALLNRIIGEIYFNVANDNLKDKNSCPHYKNNKHENLLCAAKYLDTAYILFNKINDLSSMSESSLFLSQTHEQLSDYKNALWFYKKYTEDKDSIFSRDNGIKIVNIEKNREIELRDKQILIQKLEIKNKERLSYLFIAITLIIILVAGLVLLMYISKRKSNRQLEEKNKIISEINASKDKFFSIIAHDLRSPFNSLLGFTQLLVEELSTMDKDQIQQIAVTMRKSATNLYRLLENLLEWSRLQRGLIAFNPEPILLMPKVLADTALIMESANKKEISFNYDIPENLKVYADENMLGGILRNLVSNAVKFTPKSGKVTIAAKSMDNAVECSVSDTGIGMNQEMQENLFNIDVNTSRKGTEKEPSTGLGLILCNEFVGKHGGKLWVESEEGKGSTFHFTLPSNHS